MHIWDDICRYDHQLTNTRIGSEKWRKRIPDVLYECIVHNGKNIAGSFLDLFQETERDLQEFFSLFQKLRDRCRPTQLSNCKYLFFSNFKLSYLRLHSQYFIYICTEFSMQM